MTQETLMPGETSGSNDEELLSQIEQLRARMDRLMKGGTSTSNSALLTDTPKEAPSAAPPRPAAAPPPERSRVGDLIGNVEKEVLDDGRGHKEVVAFPEEDRTEMGGSPDRPGEDRPSPTAPSGKPRPASVDGSLIAVANGHPDARPRVTSFDDLGSAVEEELARDETVPPAERKKGPGLASRFGPADEPVGVPEEPVEAVVPKEGIDESELEPEPSEGTEELVVAGSRRSPRGALVAIWGFTAITSATIALLHFMGTI